MSASTKTVGVIGGLGPAATLDFFDRILKRTKAVRDQDHLRLIIDNNTKIPDRNAAAHGNGPSPGQALAATAHGLEVAGAEFVVMACNAAHAYEADIRAALKVPFISMIAETAAAAQKLGHKRAGLLAADACLAANLYQDALKKAGIETIVLGQSAQADFMKLIYRIKSGDTGSEVRGKMHALAEGLADLGANIIVAGCTEVPIVLTQDDIDVPLVSSTDVLVEKTILFAGAELR
ncbi:MAG TPA: amino acid racemase [Hyphomonadaceae bacterium]|nr:amino acid racemase [Hyphomonadaceae bacterium]